MHALRVSGNGTGFPGSLTVALGSELLAHELALGVVLVEEAEVLVVEAGQQLERGRVVEVGCTSPDANDKRQLSDSHESPRRAGHFKRNQLDTNGPGYRILISHEGHVAYLRLHRVAPAGSGNVVDEP